MTEPLRVELPGLSLACRESGPADGPPLVLLHALGERATDWDVVLPALAPQHRVHALDLRGHGDSGRPPGAPGPPGGVRRRGGPVPHPLNGSGERERGTGRVPQMPCSAGRRPARMAVRRSAWSASVRSA
ncbi:alpha/beta fold hydrolase [Kitasatospora purpeofusca]|uniref:alpha/beta fold hydrolase n=1 Tax=Kitasatospora purpeofusca TaxID=67352 RepID=UPI002B1E8C09|nr:alpha/beta fold hydrolase [Kitasatospora purpeofusca]